MAPNDQESQSRDSWFNASIFLLPHTSRSTTTTSQPSTPITRLAGRTIIHTVLSSLQRIAFNCDHLQFLLIETSYHPFISLSHMLEMHTLASRLHQDTISGSRLQRRSRHDARAQRSSLTDPPSASNRHSLRVISIAPEPTTLPPITHSRSFTTSLDNLCTRTLSSLGHQESPLDAHEAEAKSYYIISLERPTPSSILAQAASMIPPISSRDPSLHPNDHIMNVANMTTAPPPPSPLVPSHSTYLSPHFPQATSMSRGRIPDIDPHHQQLPQIQHLNHHLTIQLTHKPHSHSSSHSSIRATSQDIEDLLLDAFTDERSITTLCTSDLSHTLDDHNFLTVPIVICIFQA
ncbi:hypothetical protein EV424DRAFT_1615578 [Suillus variegatus]|nr:hypothetical protein EV424DRAFT_1615578 [Suillus variegatus]